MENIIAFNKPAGPSSNQFLTQLKSISGITKVGHAGTLDPLASGVLIVGFGREGTKKLGTIMGQEKEYEAVIELGRTSLTDDAEGLMDAKKPYSGKIPSHEEVATYLHSFVGTIAQIPPKFSAIKQEGQPAYKAARKGHEVTLAPREVEIKGIDLLAFQWPFVDLRITCGKGVYIRSLARDLGEKLETGAYLKRLIRTRIGEWKLKECLSLEEFQEKYGKDRI